MRVHADSPDFEMFLFAYFLLILAFNHHRLVTQGIETA